MGPSAHERRLLVTGTLDTSGVGPGGDEHLKVVSAAAFRAEDIPEVVQEPDEPVEQSVGPEPVREPVAAPPVAQTAPEKRPGPARRGVAAKRAAAKRTTTKAKPA